MDDDDDDVDLVSVHALWCTATSLSQFLIVLSGYICRSWICLMWTCFSHLPAISEHFPKKNQRSQGTNYTWKTNKSTDRQPKTPSNRHGKKHRWTIWNASFMCRISEKKHLHPAVSFVSRFTEELINSHPYSYKSRGFPRVKTHGCEKKHIDPWWLVEAMETFRYWNGRKLDLRCRWLIGLQNLWKPQDFTGHVYHATECVLKQAFVGVC